MPVRMYIFWMQETFKKDEIQLFFDELTDIIRIF
jgi:hypothetical protein